MVVMQTSTDDHVPDPLRDAPPDPDTPTMAPSVANVAYAPADPASSRGHLLDIYRPARQAVDPAGQPAPSPALVVTGGSAWMAEDGKEYAAVIAPHFTAAGYTVVGVSVRSSHVATFPAQVHDIKAAIRWLRAHADEQGVDPGRIAVMGDSSGGWTASMAGLAPPSLEGEVGETGASSAVQAVVDLYGPTDFLAMDAHMLPGACETFNAMLGITECHNDAGSPESRLVGGAITDHPQRAAAANPAAYATADAPPFLIAHGQEDALVPHHQSEILYAALRDAGADVTFYSVPVVGHDKSITSEAVPEAVVVSASGGADRSPPPWAGPRPSLRTIEAFLADALG